MRHPEVVFGGENAPEPIPERECWMPYEFRCPGGDGLLSCEEDYAGGSNHYWVLRCPEHGRFTASTYHFGDFNGWVPRPWPEGGDAT